MCKCFWTEKEIKESSNIRECIKSFLNLVKLERMIIPEKSASNTSKKFVKNQKHNRKVMVSETWQNCLFYVSDTRNIKQIFLFGGYRIST